MSEIQRSETIVVVSDDPELGNLLALNLRIRGFLVEHTDLERALAPDWSPRLARPDLLIISLEHSETVPMSALPRLQARAWAAAVPVIVAATEAARLSRDAMPPDPIVIARAFDIGAIVAAARAVLTRAVPR